MKALKSERAQRMLDAKLPLYELACTGTPFTFEGVRYQAKFVPPARNDPGPGWLERAWRLLSRTTR